MKKPSGVFACIRIKWRSKVMTIRIFQQYLLQNLVFLFVLQRRIILVLVDFKLIMIKKLTKIVLVSEKEESSTASPEKRISELQLILESGETYTYRVDYAKGDPRNPMNMQEIKEKYTDLMSYAGQAEIGDTIMAALEDIEYSAEKLYSCLNENK